MPLSFAIQIMAKLFCYCHCLFDAIVDLHAMDGKNDSMTFSLEMVLGSCMLIKAYSFHDLYFCMSNSGGALYIMFKNHVRS